VWLIKIEYQKRSVTRLASAIIALPNLGGFGRAPEAQGGIIISLSMQEKKFIVLYISDTKGNCKLFYSRPSGCGLSGPFGFTVI
jgi:hypothetical protein